MTFNLETLANIPKFIHNTSKIQKAASVHVPCRSLKEQNNLQRIFADSGILREVKTKDIKSPFSLSVKRQTANQAKYNLSDSKHKPKWQMNHCSLQG